MGLRAGRRPGAELLVYGADDALAGPVHGRWWAGALPDARLQTWPGVGHLAVVPAWDAMLAHLTA